MKIQIKSQTIGNMFCKSIQIGELNAKIPFCKFIRLHILIPRKTSFNLKSYQNVIKTVMYSFGVKK